MQRVIVVRANNYFILTLFFLNLIREKSQKSRYQNNVVQPLSNWRTFLAKRPNSRILGISNPVYSYRQFRPILHKMLERVATQSRSYTAA